MAKGDIHVLDRLEKSDRRADRAARCLIRKLARTKRNGKGANHPVVTSPSFHAMSFASETNLIFHEDMLLAKRRLSKARDSEDHRAFYVDELCGGGLDPDEPGGLVVMPRSKEADHNLVAECITKNTRTLTKTSKDSITLLRATDNTTIQSADVTGNRVVVCKLHMNNGMTLFYAWVPRGADSSLSHAEPWRLGLDRKTTTSMQTVVARLIGAKLEPTHRSSPIGA